MKNVTEEAKDRGMIAEGKPLKVNIEFSLQSPQGNCFIMSMEFDKKPFKWPKIDVKKWQNLIFKVDFQRQKSFKSF